MPNQVINPFAKFVLFSLRASHKYLKSLRYVHLLKKGSLDLIDSEIKHIPAVDEHGDINANDKLKPRHRCRCA